MTRIAVHIILALAAVAALCTHVHAADEFVFVRAGNVWSARIDGSGAKQLTDIGDAREPSLSPDGRRVAFVSGRDPVTGFGNIHLIDVDGANAGKLAIRGMAGSEQPVFSPDGQSLLFVGMSDVKTRKVRGYDHVTATMSVSVVQLETGSVRRIISTPKAMLDAGYIYRSPSFSPNGKLIAYQQSGSDVSGGFVVVDLRGRQVFRYPGKPDDPTPYWRPQFSKDGKSVLCYSPATSEGEDDVIWLVDLATGRKKRVTGGANPSFSLRGQAIVFERWINRWYDRAESALFYLSLDGASEPKRVFADASEPSGW